MRLKRVEFLPLFCHGLSSSVMSIEAFLSQKKKKKKKKQKKREGTSKVEEKEKKNRARQRYKIK